MRRTVSNESIVTAAKLLIDSADDAEHFEIAEIIMRNMLNGRYPRTNVRGTLSEVICLSSGIHPRVDTRGPLRTVDRETERNLELLDKIKKL